MRTLFCVFLLLFGWFAHASEKGELMNVMTDMRLVDDALMEYFGQVTAPYDHEDPEAHDFKVGVIIDPIYDYDADPSLQLNFIAVRSKAVADVLAAAKKMGMDQVEGVIYTELENGFSLKGASPDALYAALRDPVKALVASDPRMESFRLSYNLSNVQMRIYRKLDEEALKHVTVMFDETKGIHVVFSISVHDDPEFPQYDDESLEREYQTSLAALKKRAVEWQKDDVQGVTVTIQENLVALSADSYDAIANWVWK